MTDRLHRPTLLKVREMIARDIELSEEGERNASQMTLEVQESTRRWERQRQQTFRALLASIDYAITKAKDF